MRTVQEILLQPMPPDAALSDLAEELAAVGVEAAKGQLFVARLTELLADHPTLAQLMAMSASEVKAVEAAVKFSVCDSTSLRICLGSATSPFTFKPDVVTSHPSGEAPDYSDRTSSRARDYSDRTSSRARNNQEQGRLS